MKVWTSLVPGHFERRLSGDGSTEKSSPSDDSSSVDVAVVIDVLRATTVMTTALAAGAKEVFTCLDIAEAFELAQRLSPRPLLCGERHCKPIEGFDLGNSPAEYTTDRVGSRSLVMTTTNGTRAINAAQGAGEIVLASFLNVDAVATHLSKFSTMRLICAGTDGHVTGEDVLLAGAILERLSQSGSVTYENDSCRLAASYWTEVTRREEADSLENEFMKTLGGRNLIAAGYAKDLTSCSKVDVTRVVLSCTPQKSPSEHDANRFQAAGQ